MSDHQQVALELTTTMEMVKRLKQFWNMSEGEDRKLLAHSLFEEIVYDLDTRRIVDFKLKMWAEPYVLMRAALYADQMGEEMKNRFNSGLSSEVSFCDPNGTRTRVLALKGLRPRPLDDGAERDQFTKAYTLTSSCNMPREVMAAHSWAIPAHSRFENVRHLPVSIAPIACELQSTFQLDAAGWAAHALRAGLPCREFLRYVPNFQDVNTHPKDYSLPSTSRDAKA